METKPSRPAKTNLYLTPHLCNVTSPSVGIPSRQGHLSLVGTSRSLGILMGKIVYRILMGKVMETDEGYKRRFSHLFRALSVREFLRASALKILATLGIP